MQRMHADQYTRRPRSPRHARVTQPRPSPRRFEQVAMHCAMPRPAGTPLAAAAPRTPGPKSKVAPAQQSNTTAAASPTPTAEYVAQPRTKPLEYVAQPRKKSALTLHTLTPATASRTPGPEDVALAANRTAHSAGACIHGLSADFLSASAMAPRNAKTWLQQIYSMQVPNARRSDESVNQSLAR